MKKSLVGLAVLPFLAGVSLAAQPVPLSDKQMDVVTAGFDFLEVEVQNTGVVLVAVNQPAPFACTTCYLNVVNTWFLNPGITAMQTLSQFGP